jgi:hypothetical protein
MKIFLSTLLLVAGAGFAYALHAQHGDTAAADVAAMMRPGPQHAMLQKMAGTWDVVVTMDPSGMKQRSTGTMTSAARGGFYTIEEFTGEMMGMKFLGHGVNGYCPVKKKYFTFWTDTMSGSPVSLEGDFDEKKKEMTMTGLSFGMSGTLEPVRTVTQYKDDDHYTWSMFGKGPDGKEGEHLRIEYTRKK